jgi:hypothetical protein
MWGRGRSEERSSGLGHEIEQEWENLDKNKKNVRFLNELKI